MVQIVHVIQQLTGGGAARATLYLAAHLPGYHHSILSLKPPTPRASRLADERGISMATRDALESADIVQFNWWNNVEMHALMREALLEMRTVGWLHVGGRTAPHVITPQLAEFFDVTVACSPFTYAHPAIQALPSERRAMVYGTTDGSRLRPLREHKGFRVGHVGTLDFCKLHRNFVAMNAKARLQEATFVVCGTGDALPTLQTEAQGLPFAWMGYVEDVGEVLAELDVYVCPLCEDTYAGSEMNVQEAMFAQLPVVAFPHGGVRELIRHGESGMVVHTEEEYARTLEFLQAHPEERRRLGRNAGAYAREHFGAANAAREMDRVYATLLQRPKRIHSWPKTIGHQAFLQSLGSFASVFGDDERVVASSAALHKTLSAYREAFPEDVLLHYWEALTFLGRGLHPQALMALSEVAEKMDEPRVHHFMAQAAKGMGLDGLYQRKMRPL